VLTHHADAGVRLWDLAAQKPAPLWRISGSKVAHAAVSADGRWLLTIDHDHVGQLRNVSTGEAVAKPLSLGQPATLAAIGRDGRKIALLGADGALLVWDVATGTLLAYPPGRFGKVAHVDVSPDLRLVVIGNSGGEAFVCEASNGHRLTPPLKHPGPFARLAFGSSSKQIVAVSQNGTVRVWELPALRDMEHATGLPLLSGGTPDLRPVAELVALAQVLSCSCIDEDERRQPLDVRTLQSTWKMLHPGGGER
jgi:WD40 repeat protein